MYQDVMIAGFGGQGILLAGKLLAYAGMTAGMHVTWFPSYGAEIRGGTANCTVVLSNEEIGSPIVQNPVAMLLLNDASVEKFEKRIRPGGQLFLNSSLVHKKPVRSDIELLNVPANAIAEELGNGRTANMVMVGAFLKKTGIFSIEAVTAALLHALPVGKHSLIPLNVQALQHGAAAC